MICTSRPLPNVKVTVQLEYFTPGVHSIGVVDVCSKAIHCICSFLHMSCLQIAELQEKTKALKEDNKLMNHSLSDKNAQIKLHSNQINVSDTH